ncbi:chain-length determining protein [Cutibacterium sp.]|uniref:chain-length determining protein n=1 Tax=Cutibacterium sp. TaxID=1912221 RepID=UPI0026DD21DA|nr:chain-length determining protein [Cutibacterium sp.]MDO4412640.1 chain-length determining protein [Cutibacterium sp.]
MSNLPPEPPAADSESTKPERDATAAAPRNAGSRNQPVDLLGFLKGLAQHWLAGLITFVIVAGILVGYSAIFAPKDNVGSIAAHGHVMATLPEPSTEAQATIESAAVQTIMTNYQALTTPDPIITAALNYLHDGTTAEDLKKAASTYWGGGGTVIAIYATGTTEDQAVQRANAYARAFTEKANDLVPSPVAGLPQPKLTILGPAFPSDPNPAPPENADDGTKLASEFSSPIVGVAAGVVLGLVVMGILEYRSSRRSRANN